MSPLASAGKAPAVRLFPDRKEGVPSSEQFPVRNYSAIVAGLTVGDEIEFEDGNRFEYLGRVGKGKTTHVLKVKPSKGPFQGLVMALRIPIEGAFLHEAQNWNPEYFDGDFPQFTEPAYKLTFSHYIDATLMHAELFEREGFGPKIYHSSPGQYVALELIERKFTLDEFFQGKVSLTPREMGVAEEALAHFARQIAGIISVKDIGQPGQVVYDGKRFVLVDWYGVHFIGPTIYPWAFFEWESPLGEVLSYWKVRPVDVERDPSLKGLFDFQNRIGAILEKEKKNARLDLLDQGLNPLTGGPAPGPHGFFTRNFGIWRKVYAELRKTRKARICDRELRTQREAFTSVENANPGSP